MSSTSRRSPDWKPAPGRSLPASNRSVRTRQLVVEAAKKVFGRQGFAGTSMLEIAQEAGVASGTVYHYFADKSDLFRYILLNLEDQLYRETRMPVGSDGRLVVRQAVLRYFELYREHVALFRTWWEVLEPRTEFTDAWIKLHEKSRRELIAVMETAKGAGMISREVDAGVTADLIVSMLERPAYLRFVHGWEDGLSEEEVADLMAAFLGNGLGEESR